MSIKVLHTMPIKVLHTTLVFGTSTEYSCVAVRWKGQDKVQQNWCYQATTVT